MSATISSNVAPYADLPPVNIALFEAKAREGLTFADIGKVLNRDEVWVAAAFYAQAKFNEEEIAKLTELFRFDKNYIANEIGTHWWPNRGLGEMPPKDPVIYRLYEFGDGIMSMINCKVLVEKKEDPAGDRVVLTFDGKFLPYSQW
ncbi:Cyanase [Coprinellus micaceus]|uniref:Cyanase n=1 Tax=Coprinellus micaceus TaxID=71717 RepID=A0A4Y7SAX0_COPMI|nr:Cyanase [Coprinellus micaceus]TEB18569.1 Cyanase [Coprinellus micaceus]